MPVALDLPSITVLTSAAGRCGIDLKCVLEDLGIVITAETAPFGSLPLGAFADLLELLHQRTQRGHFPFAFAEAFHFDGQPAISAYLASAHRLRDVGPLLEWIPDLIHPAIHFDGVDDGRRATLQAHIAVTGASSSGHALLIELILAVAAKVIQRTAPSVPIIHSVQLRHAAKTERVAYQHCFGCQVQFQAELDRLILNSQKLDTALPGSLPAVHAQAEESIRLSLVGDGLAPPLSLQVDAALRAHWGLFESGVNGLAQVLKMHPRTLQRRLRELGMSYSEIAARVRHDLACEMLRESQLDIDSIGFKLGFKERRSFTQAFRQWQGQTPSTYRKQSRDAFHAS